MTIYSVPYTSDQQTEMVAQLKEAIDGREARIRTRLELENLGHTTIEIYEPTEIKSPKRVTNYFNHEEK